jgi:hypothetical protein
MVYVVRIKDPKTGAIGYLWHGKKMTCLENAQVFARWKNAMKAAERYGAIYTAMIVQAKSLDAATHDAQATKDAAAAGVTTATPSTTEARSK